MASAISAEHMKRKLAIWMLDRAIRLHPAALEIVHLAAAQYANEIVKGAVEADRALYAHRMEAAARAQRQ